MTRTVQASIGGWALLAMAGASTFVAMAADPTPKSVVPAETPIIAELFSWPERFIGRSVKIYGLVVDSKGGGSRFYLQDVSQMPLTVIAPAGQPVATGAQLMVSGKVRRIGGQLVLAGEELVAVKVVAGGGCC